MSKILIFNTETPVQNTVTETTPKFYNDLNKSSNVFAEMELYDNKHKFVNSTIDVILFQQILPYVTPIIKHIPNSATLVSIEQPGDLIYKTEHNIVCFVGDTHTQIHVSKFCDINVIGVVMNEDIDKKYEHVYNYIVSPDTHIQDLVNCGVVNLHNLLVDRYFVFNKQVQFTYKSLLQPLHGIKHLYFNKNTKVVLQAIIIAIKAATDHYEHNNAILYATVHTLASTQYNTHLLQYTVPKCDKFVSELGKLVMINLCYAQQQTIALNAYNRNCYIYYTKLRLTSDNNIYNEIKYDVNIDIELNKQIILLYKKQLQMFKKSNIATKLFNTPLDKLNKVQLEQVNKAYEKSLLLNVIPELATVQALAIAMNADNKAAIRENLDLLYKIKNFDKQTTYIQINNVNIICTHVIYKANLLLEDYKDSIDKNVKIRNLLVSKYYDSSLSGYFCKICGEQLAQKDDEYDIQRGEGYSANEFDSFYLNIYREAIYICNNFVDFGNVHTHNIFTIIRNIADTLKNEILSVHANLLKVKTLGKESVSTVLSIYIYIYTFAFVSHLILTNEFISFKRDLFTGGKQMLESKSIMPSVATLTAKVVNTPTNVKRVQYILNTAISIVKKIKYKDIQDSKIISLASVNSIFLQAYRYIVNINYISVVESTDAYWDKNNAVIDYLLYVYHLSQSQMIQNTDHDFAAVMGRTYKQINEQSESIYATLIKPEKWSTNVYNNDSAISLYEYVAKNLCDYNVSNTTSELHTFYKKYEYLHALEKQRIKDIYLTRLRPTVTLVYIPYTSVLKNSKLKICKCKSQTYIYKKINASGAYTKDTLVVTLQELQKWLNDKNYKNLKDFIFYTLVEIKCNCVNVQHNHILIAFYKFYENKCPVENLHDFATNKCVKCGITLDTISTFDEKYYKKYLSTYTATKNKEYAQFKIIKKINKSEKIITFAKWEYNISYLQKISHELEITPNTIYNIGLAENKEYNSKFTKINMSVDLTQDESIKQNTNLYGYYLFIIRNYYLLKNSELLSNLPPHVSEFLHTHKLQLHKMPMLNTDFLQKYKYYKRTLVPKLFTNFLTTSICKLLLEILGVFKTIHSSAGHAYVKMIFTKIIDAEKKFSKFDIRKILKRTSNTTVENLLETQNDQEFNFNNAQNDNDNESGDDAEEEPVELDDDADNRGNEVEEEENLFSLNDIDLENDDDTIYVDVEDRQN